MRSRKIGLGLAGTFVLCVSARAQVEEAPATAPAIEVSGLKFTFTPGVWMPRVSGSAVLGPSSDAENLELRTELEMDKSEPTFIADFSVRRDEQWQIKAGGFDYSTDAHGRFDGSAAFGSLQMNPGDDFRSTFDLLSFNVEATYWFVGTQNTAGSKIMFGPTAGLRYVDADHTVTVTGEGREDTGGEWVAPYAGVELELRWESREVLHVIHQVQIAGGVCYGPALGGDGGSIWHLHADLTVMFTSNLGAYFGYKLIAINGENGDYELDGGIEGLCLGATLRF